jgi:hypothetical protein
MKIFWKCAHFHITFFYDMLFLKLVEELKRETDFNTFMTMLKYSCRTASKENMLFNKQ